MGHQSGAPGTMKDPQGALYYISPTGTATRMISDVTCSNGLAFSSAGDKLFYVDSFAYTVDVLDCDLGKPNVGELSFTNWCG